MVDAFTILGLDVDQIYLITVRCISFYFIYRGIKKKQYGYCFLGYTVYYIFGGSLRQ